MVQFQSFITNDIILPVLIIDFSWQENDDRIMDDEDEDDDDDDMQAVLLMTDRRLTVKDRGLVGH